ncbi:unnamed protein product [Effrenium voratum]|nr:unnamed protein product [Effrenium voratum]
MSDDEGPRGKGGKGKKGGGKGGGGGGGGGKSGGKGGKAGERGGMSVSRLQVLPKFLQDIHAKYKPAEDKRGLQHAELLDKSSPLGRNDDDEYDFEDAQIVDSNLTEEDIKVFQRRRSAAAPQPAVEEEGDKVMKFQKPKSDAKPERLQIGRPRKKPKEEEEVVAAFSKKKQRLSFDADEE